MIKNITLTTFAVAGLSLFSGLQAQVTVHWGSVVRNPSRSNTTRIIGADREGFYTLRSTSTMFSKNTRQSLERYDNKNNLTFSKELIIPAPAQGKINFEYQDILYLKGQLVLFTSRLNKDNDTYFSFANKVAQDGTVSNEMVELARMEGVNKAKTVDYDFDLSADSSKILVFQHRPFEKNRPERFDMKVLDHSLQPLYTKSIEMPMADKEVSIEKYIVDNAGNTYVLMKVDKPREDRSSKTQNHFYKIMAYFHKDDQIKDFDLTLADKFISDASFILDKEQNLLVSGFYADNKKMAVGGSFFLKLDPTTKAVLKTATKEFSPEFLSKFMSDRKANKEDAGIGMLQMQDMILRPDGSVIVAAEQEYIQVQTVQTKNSTRYIYHYYNNDMVIVNIAPAGEIAWMQHIPKKQHTKDDDGFYNSFSMLASTDNSVRFLFNDNPKNITITDPRKFKQMRNVKGAMTTLVTLQPDGTMQRTPLFPAKENKTIISPSFYLRGVNSMVIYGQKGKDTRFGRISFS